MEDLIQEFFNYNIGELLIFLAGLATSLGLTKVFYTRAQQYVLTTKYIRGLNSRARCTELFKNMGTLGADRVLLFNGSNCGGLPRAGAPYTVACEEAVGNNIDAELALAYNVGVSVDVHYSNLLIKMMEKGKVEFKTEDLPDEAFIKHLYLAEGITSSIWYYIGIVENKLKFYSVSRHDNQEFTEEQKIRLDMKQVLITNEILKGKKLFNLKR